MCILNTNVCSKVFAILKVSPWLRPLCVIISLFFLNLIDAFLSFLEWVNIHGTLNNTHNSRVTNVPTVKLPTNLVLLGHIAAILYSYLSSLLFSMKIQSNSWLRDVEVWGMNLLMMETLRGRRWWQKQKCAWAPRLAVIPSSQSVRSLGSVRWRVVCRSSVHLGSYSSGFTVAKLLTNLSVYQ